MPSELLNYHSLSAQVTARIARDISGGILRTDPCWQTAVERAEVLASAPILCRLENAFTRLGVKYAEAPLKFGR